MGKKYIPYVGEWLFILTSLCSLISQAMAYGKYVDTDAHDILIISLIASVAGAFIGHYITEKKYVRHGNALINKIKLLFILLPLIVYLVDAKVEPKPITFDVLLAVTYYACLHTHLSRSYLSRSKLQMQQSYLSVMDTRVIRMDELFHVRRKPFVLLVTAIPLTTFSIFVADNPSAVNMYYHYSL